MADLFAFSEAHGEIKKHVIFFHGLGGHHFYTWQASPDSGVCWPQWLAEDIEGLAVWSVGYKASVSRWRGKTMHLTDRATNVLERLLLEPSLQTGELVLIGHSLGGLVIKQLLRTADSLAPQRDEVAKFIKRVRRIAFLASPHSGSDLASWGDKLRVLIRPSAATASLLRNDPNLRDLNLWYREWSGKNEIEHLILAESQPIKFSGLVVKPDSSDPGLYSRPISMDANHFSICKPENRLSEIYLIIRNFITKVVDLKIDNESLINNLKAQDTKIDSILQQMDAFKSPSNKTYPRGLIDAEITRLLLILRHGRFFQGFPVFDHAMRLAEKIQSGEYQSGSDEIKSSALAWCARLLTTCENKSKSNEFLDLSKKFGSGEEIKIAEAFRSVACGDLDGALDKLSALESYNARTATFIIISNHKSPTDAIEWLSKSDLSLDDLDPDGKFFLITRKMELNEWQTALELSDSLKEDDYKHTPVLFQVSAMANLMQAVPDEFKLLITHGPPFELRAFRLSSDQTSLEYRKKAQGFFQSCANCARELGCTDTANIAEDYSLWLELRDLNSYDAGVKKLQISMRDSAHSLRRLHFALQFGLKLDLDAVEKEIDRQTSLSFGKSHIAAQARFALAFTHKSPKDIATYIGHHRTQLYEYLDKKTIHVIEIEMLARAGLPLQAEERLNELAKDGITETERAFLRKVIGETSGGNPLEAQKNLFETSGKLIDLINLVNMLEEQKEWPQVCHYGLQLFHQTRDLPDAERLALALNETNRFSELSNLLRTLPDFINQSDSLKMLWSWSLYREGLLSDSAEALGKLLSKRDHPNDRALMVNLAIASGDWDSLLSWVEKEWANKEQREANDLISTAQLAQIAGSPRSKELMHAAALKGAGNAKILLAAYFLATRAGWENEEIVARWLHEAAELSTEGGPIQRMAIKDLLDRAPEWNRRETETWQQLNKGTIPIFGAAHLLNRSLIDMFLLPALANPYEPDLRKRSLVPAYSGVRQSSPCKYRVIAIDSTALLTLGMLSLLELTFSFFERIIIPHSTLNWLFSEKQEVSFHQPSRIKNANKIRDLLAIGALKEFPGSAEMDSDLAAEIGDELASLIAEAHASASVYDRQGLVIRSCPVHRIGSLMEEEADLSPYYPYLVSCSAIVGKLKQKGQLTASEEHRARSYLSLNEKEWPCQPDVHDGAILYLDNLSVIYLQQAGVLEKLRPAGFEVYVSAREKAEVDALLRYQQLTSEVSRVIEYIRSCLAAGIKSEKVRVGKLQQADLSEETTILKQHPTIEVFNLAEEAEAIVVDDRYINQHPHFGNDSEHTLILTTCDLIEAFHLNGDINFEQKLDYYTNLRRAGYLFIPITREEIDHYLNSVKIIDGRLVETAELKAIRESFLRIRMSHFLQLPKEAPWLASSMQILSNTLKNQWLPEIDETTCRARSEWLRSLLDLRGWAHCIRGANGLNLIGHGYGAQQIALFFTPSNMDSEKKLKYWEWIEEFILKQIKEEDPETYTWILNRVKEHIVSAIEATLAKELA